MKFGKLHDLSKVSFQLPPDPPGTSYLLEKLADNKEKPQIFVGCTGWSMKEWLGKVYPKGTKAKDYLYHYARQFSTIELNSTHYGIPALDTIAKWRKAVPDSFRFCPKIPQRISHSPDLGMPGDLIPHFSTAVTGMGETMGCCFMQLPPYFKPINLKKLQRFLDVFPSTIPLALEVRHEDWFSDEGAFAALFDLLEEKGVSSVITDVAGRRDVLHNRLTTDTLMLRWVGNGLHATDYKRIDEWVLKLQSWFEQGLKRAFIFLHEPDNLLAPEIVVYFTKRVNDVLGLQMTVPDLSGGARNISGQIALF